MVRNLSILTVICFSTQSLAGGGPSSASGQKRSLKRQAILSPSSSSSSQTALKPRQVFGFDIESKTPLRPPQEVHLGQFWFPDEIRSPWSYRLVWDGPLGLHAHDMWVKDSFGKGVQLSSEGRISYRSEAEANALWGLFKQYEIDLWPEDEGEDTLMPLHHLHFRTNEKKGEFLFFYTYDSYLGCGGTDISIVKFPLSSLEQIMTLLEASQQENKTSQTVSSSQK